MYDTGGAAADAMGINRPTYYGHENGSRNPDPDEWKEYARKFKVHTDWLLYEIGPRDRASTYLDELDDLTPEERESVSAFIETIKNRRARRSA